MLTEMTNQRYGRATVVKRVENDKYGNARWLCVCDCGNSFITNGYALRSGHSKSCGCFRKEQLVRTSTKHGMAGGKNRHPLYGVLHGMKARCYSEKSESFKHYGKRGIKICDQWLKDPTSFIAWAYENGYGEGLTIDRMDNNKGYSPENCQFVSRAIQNKNTTRVNRVKSDYGELTTAEVAEMIGVSRSTTAKWYRYEGLRTVEQFIAREKFIGKRRSSV